MTRRLIPLLAILVALPAFAKTESPPPTKPLIQVAILLDTSGSMDGLIDQARTQLWTIVNEFAKTKKEGQTPQLQVALYEYGNDGLAAKDGFIRRILPLTDDLDAISEKLFSLRTNGGSEFCGQVIDVATRELAWSDSLDVYKVIFIAGNEPFTQGPVNFRDACPRAATRGIIVNTIHCGTDNDPTWAEGARMGEGRAMNIDQNKAIVALAAPQDAEITKLSTTLNDTYIPYGRVGAENSLRQVAQDANASTQPASGAPVQRAVSKANGAYQNGGWDLVDAVNQKQVKLAEVADKDLPEAMRSMSGEKRKEFVEAQSAKRDEIQKKINSLNAEREKFVAEKKRESSADTLDAAILTAVREQLVQKKFEAVKSN